jgi:hypothetical protein
VRVSFFNRGLAETSAKKGGGGTPSEEKSLFLLRASSTVTYLSAAARPAVTVVLPAEGDAPEMTSVAGATTGTRGEDVSLTRPLPPQLTSLLFLRVGAFFFAAVSSTPRFACCCCCCSSTALSSGGGLFCSSTGSGMVFPSREEACFQERELREKTFPPFFCGTKKEKTLTSSLSLLSGERKSRHLPRF